MTRQRKRVLLLFGGGTSLIHRDGSVREVSSSATMEEWLRQIPELGLIAAVEPQFLYNGGAFDVQPGWWQKITQTILKHYRAFDGFIVTQAVDAIPYSGAALSLMLGHVGKPVVITGSPEIERVKIGRVKKGKWWQGGEIGIRANLINAAQVATLDIGEVAVLFGNRLLRAGTVIRQTEPSLNVFDSVGVAPLGRVDFGLKLENHRRRRSTRIPKAQMAIKSRVLQVAIVPSTAPLVLPELDPHKIDGLLLSGQPFSAPAGTLERFRRHAEERAGVPIAVYARWPRKRMQGLFFVSNVTSATALVKFMWALGQTAEPKKLQTLLDEDRAGEVVQLQNDAP